jgi:hypothetical protein
MVLMVFESAIQVRLAANVNPWQLYVLQGPTGLCVAPMYSFLYSAIFTP